MGQNQAKPVPAGKTNYNPDVEVIQQKLNNPHYGEVKVVKDKATGQHFYLKEVVVNTKQAYDSELEFLRHRVELSHPNVAEVVGYNAKDQHNFCSTYYKISIFIEVLENTLLNELENRITTQNNFSESEVLLVADNLISGLSYFQSQGFSHGDIRPYNVFVHGNHFKLSDPSLGAHKGQHGLHLSIIQGQKAFLAPELVSQVPSSDFEIKSDKGKADVFSLGVTLLSLASLSNCEDLYDYQHGKVNEDLLRERLEHVRGRYSDYTWSLIRSMLNINEQNRPDFVSLSNTLLPYQDQIRASAGLNYQNKTEQHHVEHVQATPESYLNEQTHPHEQAKRSVLPEETVYASNPSSQNAIKDDLESRIRAALERSEATFHAVATRETELRNTELTKSYIATNKDSAYGTTGYTSITGGFRNTYGNLNAGQHDLGLKVSGLNPAGGIYIPSAQAGGLRITDQGPSGLYPLQHQHLQNSPLRSPKKEKSLTATQNVEQPAPVNVQEVKREEAPVAQEEPRKDILQEEIRREILQEETKRAVHYEPRKESTEVPPIDVKQAVAAHVPETEVHQADSNVLVTEHTATSHREHQTEQAVRSTPVEDYAPKTDYTSAYTTTSYTIPASTYNYTSYTNYTPSSYNYTYTPSTYYQTTYGTTEGAASNTPKASTGTGLASSEVVNANPQLATSGAATSDQGLATSGLATTTYKLATSGLGLGTSGIGAGSYTGGYTGNYGYSSSYNYSAAPYTYTSSTSYQPTGTTPKADATSNQATPVHHTEVSSQKEATPVSQQKEATPVSHKEATPVSQQKEATPVHHAEVSSQKEATPVSQQKEATPVHHAEVSSQKEATPVSQQKEATPVSQQKEATLVHQETPSNKSYTSTQYYAGEQKEATPVSQQKEATPVSHKEATPVSQQKEATPVHQETPSNKSYTSTQYYGEEQKEATPVSQQKEATPVHKEATPVHQETAATETHTVDLTTEKGTAKSITEVTDEPQNTTQATEEAEAEETTQAAAGGDKKSKKKKNKKR